MNWYYSVSKIWGALRTELVDRVAAALAEGVGFDAILWYFIWLCWFDCARSSILPDASRYPSKAFCFIGLPFCLADFRGRLMILMHHLNADLETRRRRWWWEKNRDPCGGNTLGIWKSDVRGVSGWGWICSKCRCYTGVEYQMLKSLSGILKCD